MKDENMVGASHNNNQSDDSDDDPVVEEFDLYLNNMGSSGNASELHLLQFPLRHFNRPYGDQGKLLKVEVAYEAGKKLGYAAQAAVEIAEKTAASLGAGGGGSAGNKPVSNFRFRY